jgi:hypothetical protein
MQKIIDVRVSREMLSLVNTINNMIDQLAIFLPVCIYPRRHADDIIFVDCPSTR